MFHYELGEMIYENPLAASRDIDGWRMEGDGVVSFPMGRMRQEGLRDPREGQTANIVHWCPQTFPDHLCISWDFYPIREPGLAILFFAARGRHAEDVLSDDLAPRNGPYEQYHSGDIDALHVSYFRRKHPGERAFTTCNLRKSRGFHLVAQGADPIPSIPDAMPPYRIEVIKSGPHVGFRIANQATKALDIFHWMDDGQTVGPVLTAGQIGFRQMVPLIAEYADLRIHRLVR